MADVNAEKGHGFLMVVLAAALALVVFYPLLQSVAHIFGLAL